MKIIPRIMLAVLAVVTVLHIGAQFLPEDTFFQEFFDAGYEQNLPTWVANIFWFIVSSSALVCYARTTGKRWWMRIPWLLIAGLFMLASLDEIAELHEETGHWFHQMQLATGNPRFQRDGSPGSPWILVFAPALAIAIGGMTAFFAKTLGKRLTLVCCGAFLCFLIAIGMDFFQGMYDPTRDQIAAALHVNKRWLVYTSIAVEEILELLGMTLLAYAFCTHAQTLKPPEAN